VLGTRPLGGAVEDTDLAERVERLHRVETVATAERLRCIAEVDARQAWRVEGARSTVQRPHVILIALRRRWRARRGRRRRGWMVWVRSVLRRRSCSAVTPRRPQVFMARNGEVLDAGRTRREPTRPQRIAVIARDQVCVGCGAPA
jgi:hypothetical protein